MNYRERADKFLMERSEREERRAQGLGEHLAHYAISRVLKGKLGEEVVVLNWWATRALARPLAVEVAQDKLKEEGLTIEHNDPLPDVQHVIKVKEIS